MSDLRVGIDVGGTFTDAYLLDGDTGDLVFVKVPSTPDEPQDAVIHAFSELVTRAGSDPAEVTHFVHGTTLAINALTQHLGTPTGLIVTAGFRDLLEIGRGRLPAIHDFNVKAVSPIAPRFLVGEVRERLYADGSERESLDIGDVLTQADNLILRGARALAVAFLHSYKNPTHELAAVAAIHERHPEIYVCASSQVWPQAREYERAMAAMINAHIGAPMKEYYERLTEGLRDAGLRGPVMVTRSAGGIVTAQGAAAAPVETLMSGPASGVLGAAEQSARVGLNKVICFDMGGTTADVSVVDGHPKYAYESEIAGYVLSMPTIDIVSIGAGGGSIAWLDGAGVLRVGPHSAGADPGPAAYGSGGTAPTITDAYVALGYIADGRLLAGSIPVNAAAARSALSTIAEQTGETVVSVASQIVGVATANMYAALMPLMTRQGIDLADFAMVAYGGAGPTQAFFLCEELGINHILVPPIPGGVCALGCLTADFKAERVHSLYRKTSDASHGDLDAVFESLEVAAGDWMRDEGATAVEHHCVRSADMRYVGQSFEVNVDVPASANLGELAAAFHRKHEAIYGFADATAETEITDLRVQLIGVTPKPRNSLRARHQAVTSDRTGMAWFGDAEERVRFVPRESLVAGVGETGPLVIEQYDTTIVVPNGWRLSVDTDGNLHGLHDL